MKSNITFLIIVTALFIGKIANGQSKTQKIDSLLTAFYKDDLFNGNVLIAEKGKVIYKKSFGFANNDTKEVLDENSPFELASVSKQFTAMAIMMLRVKGKLSLEDDITKHIPELSFWKGITIGNLVYHTSGLPDYMELLDSFYKETKIPTNKDLVLLLAEHKPKVLFEPNTKYEYCNTGYFVLAYIIEKVSGTTYANFLKTNIFRPLKINNFFVYSRRLKPQKIKKYAFGFTYSNSFFPRRVSDGLA
jgi:CubicO group peptidase (beta-lactamase class C family)